MLNVAVVLGNPSANVCTKVSKLRDDLNLTPYLTLGEFFRESEYAQYPIERVVVAASVLRLGNVDNNISRLRDLIRSQSNFANVVFLCKEETDAELEELLVHEFTPSECAVLSITSSSVTSVTEYLSLDIQELKDRYGYYSPDVSEDAGVLDDSVDVPTPPASEVEQPVEKKKSGFLDSLFGRSKKKEEEKEVEEPNNSEATEEVEEEVESEPASEESENTEADTDSEEEVTNSTDEVDEEVDEEPEEVTEEEEELSEETSTDPSSLDSDDVEGENYESSDSVLSELNDVRSTPELVEVEDTDTLINYGTEDKYREDTAKVVERVVERVVEKPVPVVKGKRSIFESSAKRLIVVTGDRGSGVTTMASTIANVFASNKCNTLYVDCDVVRHGILSYIDYAEFKKQDKVKRNATAVCKTWDDIERGIYQVSATMGILTADYGVVTEDGGIEDLLTLIADYYTKFDCVVIDLPLEYIKYAYTVLSMGIPILTVKGTLGGVIGAISELEVGCCSDVLPRYLTLLAKKGIMLATCVDKTFKFDGLLRKVDSYIDSDYPWTKMRYLVNPKIDAESLSYMLEV